MRIVSSSFGIYPTAAKTLQKHLQRSQLPRMNVDAKQSQLDDGLPLGVGVPHHHLGVHHHPTTLPHQPPPWALLVTNLEVLRGRHDLLGRTAASSEAPA